MSGLGILLDPWLLQDSENKHQAMWCKTSMELSFKAAADL